MTAYEVCCSLNRIIQVLLWANTHGYVVRFMLPWHFYCHFHWSRIHFGLSIGGDTGPWWDVSDEALFSYYEAHNLPIEELIPF